MSSVLSTKKLWPNQKELLLNSGIGLVEMDFISILPLDFEIPEIPANLIFTSKNAVKIILDHPKIQELRQSHVFCVGEKTAEFLQKNNFKVIKTASYGSDLAKIIVQYYPEESFLFFCGKRRNPELGKQLRKNDISLTEVEVYETILSPKKLERIFDGILFYSPGGVESFCQLNSLKGTTAFCIGNTTASEAEKYAENIVVANKPTIENLIVQVVKKLK